MQKAEGMEEYIGHSGLFAADFSRQVIRAREGIALFGD
jgi:hypothetical protein